MGGESSEPPPWRRRLRRELTGLLALKVAALVLLWWFFFSPAHHITVDGEAASRRFGVAPPRPQHQAENRAPEPLTRTGLTTTGPSQ
jgi:hypothetical protein